MKVREWASLGFQPEDEVGGLPGMTDREDTFLEGLAKESSVWDKTLKIIQ